MKKIIICTTLLVVVALAGACGRDENVIRVGVVGAFNQQWDLIAEMVAEEGIVLEIVTFGDFLTPNRALDDGDLDINAFQHKSFLANEIATFGYEIEYFAETFLMPLNIFKNPERISSIADIQDGHTIGMPSDPINTSRSLRLLESAGLISLYIPEGEIASTTHITEFHVDIYIIPAEAGMLARMLPDMEAAIINGVQALTAGLYPDIYSIWREDITEEFREGLTNVIVARSEDIRADGERMRMFRIIANAYHSPEVYAFMWEEFGGVAIPVWD